MDKQQVTAQLLGLQQSAVSLAPDEIELPPPLHTGTKIRGIRGQVKPNTLTWVGEIEEEGFGFEILSGADAWEASAAISITLLTGSEREDGALRTLRTFQLGEVYNGAIIIGQFERIRVTWLQSGSTTSFNEATLRLRIFKREYRAVPVHGQDLYQGRPVFDWMTDVAFSLPASTGTGVEIYTDEVVGVPLWRQQSIALGRGLGVDFKSGFHRSIKRAIVGHFVASRAWELELQLGNLALTAWTTVATWQSATRAALEPGPTTNHVIRLGTMGATDDAGVSGRSGHFELPGAPFRLRGRSQDITAGTGQAWLSFLGR